MSVFLTCPKNLKEQERMFFDTSCKVNPVFKYYDFNSTTKHLAKFQPDDDEQLLQIAIKIIKAFLKDYKSEDRYLELEGEQLTQEQTEEYYSEYIRELGLEDNLTLHFTQNAVAPTSITHGAHNRSKINIKVPIEYNESRISGVMHHEIGTHFMRKLNESNQPWSGIRKEYGMRPFVETEEGFACINQQLDNTSLGRNHKRLKPYLFRPALYYYVCHIASQMSFVEMYDDLEKFIKDPKRRWKYCVRAKRGIKETIQSGGFYKDVSYLKGAIEILSRRSEINFVELYSGKISLSDYFDIKEKRKNLNFNTTNMHLPKFIENYEMYLQQLDEIAKVNFVE